MSLRYVSHDHYAHPFDDAFPERSILYFDPRTELSNEPIGDRIRELGDDLRWSDLIILRGSNERFLEEVEEDLVLAELLPKVPVLVLSPDWDPENSEPQLRAPSWAQNAVNPPSPHELRHYEVLAMLEQSGSIFEDNECHYQLPSQTHAAAFVRLADGLCDVVDTVRIADWLLPSLSPDCGLLADNGSLQGLLNATVLEGQERFNWPRIPITTLRRYPNWDRLNERIEGFRTQRWSHLICVISVNSSGELARLALEREEVAKTIVICETSDQPGGNEAICAYPVERWNVGEDSHCPVCKEHHLLVIDTQSYEVRTDLHAEPRKPDIGIAEDQKAFWEAADRSEAVMLHVEREIPKRSGTDLITTRHMAIYIDITRLLADERFRPEAIARLQAGSKPDLVIIPEHASTEALDEFVREAFEELGPKAVLRYDGDELEDVERTAIAQAKEVLILDDALITGSTLFRIRSEIYRITQDIGRQVPFRAFVIVARPAHVDGEKSAQRRLSMPRRDGRPGADIRFDVAARVLLPSDRECSFCEEREALTRRRGRVSDGEAEINARIDDLANKTAGLQEPILLGGTEGTGKTVGSFFGELNPRTAIAAAASVAQRQKRDFETNRRANTIEVLDSAFVVDAYFDPGLMAGVLRNFDRRDLRNPEQDHKFNNALRERGKELADGALVEIAWAASLGKLPSDAIIELLEESETIEARKPLLELLRLD